MRILLPTSITGILIYHRIVTSLLFWLNLIKSKNLFVDEYIQLKASAYLFSFYKQQATHFSSGTCNVINYFSQIILAAPARAPVQSIRNHPSDGHFAGSVLMGGHDGSG